MKSAITVALALSLLSSEATASWFSRNGEGGSLVLTGVATNTKSTPTAAYFSCKADTFEVEILTPMKAKPDDLPTFEGVKVIISYKTRQGETKTLRLLGQPISSAGGALSVKVMLDRSQSAALADTIGRGKRLDIALLHPELRDDQEPKAIYSDGFTTATLAMAEYCPWLGV